LLPPLPEGRPPPAGVTIPNAISQTLQAYPPEKLADIISQFKAVATSNPEQGQAALPPVGSTQSLFDCNTNSFVARQLLMASPQLAYATFQAMLMMQLVDPSVLQHVVASTGQQAQSQPPPLPPSQPPVALPFAPPQPQHQQPVYQPPSVAAPTYLDPQQQQRVRVLLRLLCPVYPCPAIRWVV